MPSIAFGLNMEVAMWKISLKKIIAIKDVLLRTFILDSLYS